MNKFNLTFRGEILPGMDPAQVKTRLGHLLGINDPDALAQCFSGKTVILRRDLDRKSAADYYAKLAKLGARAELITIKERDAVRPPAPQTKTITAKETRRRAAEEKKKRSAEQAEQARQKAREAARLAAEQDERKRLAVKAAAQRKAEQARQKAQEAARREAEHKRLAAEAAALRKAEQQRLEAEEAARRLAEDAERKRLAAEAAAQRKAEQKRRKAEKSARRKAELAQRKRQAEEAARREAELAERKRLEALQAEQEAQRHREEAALEKARQQRQRAEEQARLKQIQADQLALRKAMEEQAIQRAAAELADTTSLKPSRARVKTSLELPHRGSRQGYTTQNHRKRQPGEPNLYSLRPFRNTPDIQARVALSGRGMKAGFTTAALAFIAMLVLIAGLLGFPPPPPLTGATAMATDTQGQLVLLAGDKLLLHDRSGTGTGEQPIAGLGLASMAPPLAFSPTGELFANGLLTDEQTPQATSPQLLRCELPARDCRVFSGELAQSNISGIVIHPLDGTVFLADTNAGELLKLNPQGEIVARVAADIPPQPVLALDSGLLLMNSAQAPAVSIFRYEDSAFGVQLDEVLLLPPAAIAAQQSRIGSFVRGEESWWVTLYNPDHSAGSTTGLYRFDPGWKLIAQAELANATATEQLAAWGSKILALNSGRVPLQRFSAQGTPEVPLVSTLLEAIVDDQERATNLRAISARIGPALLLLLAVAAWSAGFLYRVRGMVYKTCKGRGVEPIDELADSIEWVNPASNRAARLRRTTISYALLAAALVLLTVGLEVSVIQLSSLLIALTGPAVALTLLHRGDPGYIGTVDERLLLVDHTGMYHLGGGSRIQYRGRFLIIDDVTVFTGTRLLPVFALPELVDRVKPLVTQGVKVDRRIVMVKLLQGRHPLALGATTILGFLAAAIATLSLQGLY